MEDKNKIHIEETKALQRELVSLRNKIEGKYNNREMSLVVTKLQEAEHWLAAYRAILKSK